jgi:hypothetical protein
MDYFEAFYQGNQDNHQEGDFSSIEGSQGRGIFGESILTIFKTHYHGKE